MKASELIKKERTIESLYEEIKRLPRLLYDALFFLERLITFIPNRVS